MVDVTTIKNRDHVKFRSLNPFDGNLYDGVVIGMEIFDSARRYGTDLAAYNQQVQTAIGSELVPDALDFLIVKDVAGTVKPFATAWISPTSLELVETGNNITIKVYNVSEDRKDTLLSILRDNGYVCSVQ